MFYGDESIDRTGLELDLVNGTIITNSSCQVITICPITGSVVNDFEPKKWKLISNEFKRARRLMMEVSFLSHCLDDCEVAMYISRKHRLKLCFILFLQASRI